MNIGRVRKNSIWIRESEWKRITVKRNWVLVKWLVCIAVK